MTNDLVFDESNHKYYLDKEEIPSVTSIIRAGGFMPDHNTSDSHWYMLRGTAIHKATALYDTDMLDESEVDKEIKGFLESYKKLRLEYEPEEIEIKLADPEYKFAGTLDRIDLELKSGSPRKWHILQVAAYSHLKKINKLGTSPLEIIYLKQNGGKPAVKEFRSDEINNALDTFFCLLNIYKTKKKWKINNQEEEND